MANPSLRFIHASDFHLERPLCPVGEISESLRDAFLNAPFRAAERVFDAAISEQVDFVLLAGDLLQPMAAGPRGLVFLVEQFERLHERAIPIYWATGRADASTRWSDVLCLPPNVHLFAGPQVKRASFEREGRLRTDILGTGAHEQNLLRPTDFRAAPGHVSIALAYGRLESPATTAHGIHYWALGGAHRRRKSRAQAPLVHYPGTPQGRSQDEGGPHGCSLVQIDESYQVRIRAIATGVVRWHTEEIRLDGSPSRGALERLLESRAQALINAAPQHELIVHWKVHVPGRLANELRRGKLASEILSRLRAEFGAHRPSLWSASLEAELPSGVPEGWYAEETIRGEFLRALREYSSPAAAPPDLRPFLGESHIGAELSAAVLMEDPVVRHRVLAEATMLGADLLSGEESHA